MKLGWGEIQSKAVAFSKKWKNAHNEKSEAQLFTKAFLEVFGVDEPNTVGQLEYQIQRPDNSKRYIDYLWKGHIAIEMKSQGLNLDDAFEQLRKYMEALPPEDEIPDLWMVCDFENIWLSHRSTKELIKFKTKDLRKYIKLFANIAGHATEQVRIDQVEVNEKAAKKMAKLHDALKNIGYDGHKLEVYLVRLLFCMFAEDTGIFHSEAFFHYVEKSKADGSDLADRLRRLFETLDMSPDIRSKRTTLSEELKAFQYINGSLFSERLETPDFDSKMRQTLLDCVNFDWSNISPAIFGAMFQGVMDKNRRREIGAHYTSEENILKLIKPLFLDELWYEFERVKTTPKALKQFHEKIASMKFLDPACGCGNFLIITYRELRLLELEILKWQDTRQLATDVSLYLLKVNVEQFYGIEYEEFPCQIARVGMWLADHQMNLLVSEQFGKYYARLPLQKGATVVNDNALRIDWESVVPKAELSYILGNPPFVGYKMQNKEQKIDMHCVFGDIRNLDYVCAWYKKAIDYMKDTGIKCAFVSTNSITQGEQVVELWKPFFEQGVHINFGIPTFKWGNEAKGKAAVHCVIVGFSFYKTDNDLNPYLLKAPTIFIERCNKPICDVPLMGKGNEMYDDCNLIIEADEYEDFIKKEPLSEKYIKRYVGSEEFINNQKRYCLWFVDVSPSELRQMPEVMKRIEAVKKFRLNSKREATRKTATTPTTFSVIHQPKTNYILFPVVSSEKRDYIPIGFMSPEVIVSYAVFTIPNATLYHFGILTSIVHNAWTRAICGRLKSDYRYSGAIIYNNFPWPGITGEQKTEIEKLAQSILDARAKFPESSLADLYDPLTMPSELLKAHQELDKVVMKIYKFKKDMVEMEIVTALMEMYQKLIGEL